MALLIQCSRTTPQRHMPSPGKPRCGGAGGATIGPNKPGNHVRAAVLGGPRPEATAGPGPNGRPAPHLHNGEKKTCPGDRKRLMWGLSENAHGSSSRNVREKQVWIKKTWASAQTFCILGMLKVFAHGYGGANKST